MSIIGGCRYCNDSGAHCDSCNRCDDHDSCRLCDDNKNLNRPQEQSPFFHITYSPDRRGLTNSSHIATVASKYLGWQVDLWSTYVKAFGTGVFESYVTRDLGWDTTWSDEWPDEYCTVGRKLRTTLEETRMLMESSI
jgi:hypothetical protein